ncbi:MAG: 1-deoxy-D-xylulose-5-phosphate reductoisomerase, partial [Candidatus Neomarinimicrobiota bacterium]
MRKALTILGSTGSIGVNTLKVVQNLADDIEVIGLSAHKNAALLIKQARLFSVKTVAVSDLESAEKVDRGLSGSGIEILRGRQGVLELAGRDNADILLNGLVGSAGMEPTIKAIRAGVNIALSNKESLVMAGNIIEKEKLQSGAEIFPVDSEHSAIWQCLSGESRQDLKRIILTGSGGPFRTRAVDSFVNITPEDALNHPNWDMGSKITVDSATMMNKGLEVIEARWLFDLKPEEIDMV